MSNDNSETPDASPEADLRLLPCGVTQPVVCVKCADEVASGAAGETSLQAWAMLEVGFTAHGFQVWCRRHDANIVHVDFDGARPRADFRCLEPKVRH